MRAAIYARYSSRAQREASIDDQVSECRNAAKVAGDEVVAIYADRARSGTRTEHRDEFLRMVADSRSGGWGRIWVWRIDRFARNRYDSAIFRHRLSRYGVEVKCAAEPTPDGPAGILMEAVMEGLAEYYSAGLSEAVRRGQRGNAMRCHPNGQRRFGWRIAGDLHDHYEIDEVEAAWVREMYQMRSCGSSFSAIACDLAARGCVSTVGRPVTAAVVTRIVRDEAYRGTYRFGDVVVPGGMPRVVDDRLWSAAQSAPKRPTRHAKHIMDLVGMRFGALDVISYHETRKHHRKWLCRCDCGATRVEWGTRLTSGHAVDCGCGIGRSAMP